MKKVLFFVGFAFFLVFSCNHANSGHDDHEHNHNTTNAIFSIVDGQVTLVSNSTSISDDDVKAIATSYYAKNAGSNYTVIEIEVEEKETYHDRAIKRERCPNNGCIMKTIETSKKIHTHIVWFLQFLECQIRTEKLQCVICGLKQELTVHIY